MSLADWNNLQIELFKEYSLTNGQIRKIAVALNPLRIREYSPVTKQIARKILQIEKGVLDSGYKGSWS